MRAKVGVRFSQDLPCSWGVVALWRVAESVRAPSSKA
jgi:hypothetical protein